MKPQINNIAIHSSLPPHTPQSSMPTRSQLSHAAAFVTIINWGWGCTLYKGLQTQEFPTHPSMVYLINPSTHEEETRFSFSFVPLLTKLCCPASSPGVCLPGHHHRLGSPQHAICCALAPPPLLLLLLLLPVMSSSDFLVCDNSSSVLLAADSAIPFTWRRVDER